MGSVPTFNPEHLRQAGHRVDVQRSSTTPTALSADQPRDQSAVPDRLDVQADHRHRGARERRLDAERDLRRHRHSTASVRRSCRHNAGNAAYGAVDLREAIKVSSDDFFYNLGAQLNVDPVTQPNGGALQQWAHQLGIGRKTGIDLGGETAGILPTPKWRAARVELRTRARRCERKHHVPQLRNRRRPRPWSVGDNEQPRGRAGRRRRSRRCSSRSPTRRSPTAARSCARTSGWRSTRRDGHRAAEDRRRRPARHLQHQPDVPRRDPRRACTPPPRQPGGTSADVMRQLPRAGLRQDRHRPATTARPTSPGTCASCPTATNKPILVVVTVEQGGFGAAGRGAGGAPDPVAVVLRQVAGRSRPDLQDTVSVATRISPPTSRRPRPRAAHAAADRPAAAARGARARRLLADHAEGRHHDHQSGPPDRTTSSARRSTRASGWCSRSCCRRFDYSRAARATSYGLYGAADRAQPGRVRRARRARRAPLDPAAVLPVPVRRSSARCC